MVVNELIYIFKHIHIHNKFLSNCFPDNFVNVCFIQTRSNEDTDSSKSPESASANSSSSASSSSSAETSDEKTPKRSRKSKLVSPQNNSVPTQNVSPQNNRIPTANNNRLASDVTVAQNSDSEMTVEPQQPELSDQVSSIDLADSSSATADGTKETSAVVNITVEGDKDKEKEAPKKKRIQITTLSFLKKK